MSTTFPLSFHVSHRAAFKASRDAVMRSLQGATANVPELLSKTERLRFNKVDALIKRGEVGKIYLKENRDKTADQGGLDLDRAAREIERRNQADNARSQAHFDGLVTKWMAKPASTSSGHVQLSINMLEGRKVEAPVDPNPRPTVKFKGLDGVTQDVPNPDYHQCSFCGKWSHRDHTTFGNGPLTKGRKLEEVIVAGVVEIREKIVHFTAKAQACPEHCLLLAEHTRTKANGKVVNVGTKTRFTDTRG